MDALGMLVAQPKASSLELAQQLSHVKYTAPLQTSSTNDREVTTIESRGLILSGGTTGNRTWEAALHLGSFLASPAGEALVRGKRVIELGAGTGFLSLFCARHLGVQGVVSTDREPVLIENMRECVRFNHQYDGIFPFYPAVWDWGTPLEKTEELESFVEGDGLRFDVALGADLVRIICLFNKLPFSGHFY
jgi:predicted nicotinamide N-methyase